MATEGRNLKLSKASFIYLVIAGLTLTLLSCSVLQSIPAPTATPVSTSTETPTPTTAPLSTETLAPTSTSTETPAPSSTPTISSTPTLSVTPFPRPTKTSTPQPRWVTDFAQPILDIIALRPPKFQDDFDDKSGGWQIEGWCEPWRMKYQAGELVLTSCGARRAKLAYTDFVAKLDGRFLPDTHGDASWAIFFRDIGGPSYLYGVNYDGSIGLWGFGQEYQSFPSAAIPGYQTNHLLLIAKGSKFAFYANDKPVYFINDANYQWGDIWIRAWGGGSANIADNPTTVAFDNFMIWNISDISTP
jgi:hypothetical protein